ncbi:MAG TPA: RagB/SusD family nutrient uptake outer membrane protein [Puia sp.]|nr:RagB/SusD family nutrient uptake outer membrane protein [Puia sp.]
MKRFLKISCAGLIAIVLINSSCKKVLEEHPQSVIVPSIFNTPGGLLGGVAGVYNDLRGLWGTEGFSMQNLGGVDETLEAASASSVDFFTYNPMNGADESNGFWNNAYQDINTLNGVLQFGASVKMDSLTKREYFAQCKFLRAFWYFYLVQNFGDVPLHLTYISLPSTGDTRQPMADVYTQIIKDLTEASTELQVQSLLSPTSAQPFGGKAAAQGAALYLLGKTYLTRGWSSATQPTDFAQAATTLSGLITNKAKYGFDLWQDYADAFGENAIVRTTYDYGKESIFVSDHSTDPKYGQYVLGGGASGGAAQNILPWFGIWNYPATSGINSYKNGAGALVNLGTNMMTRDVANGRPFIRVRPNNTYILGQAFAERNTDTRYDKTFQTVWIANTAGVSTTAATANNSRGISYTLNPGVDTAVWIPPFEVPGAPQFNGATPFKGIIIPPSLQTNIYFPAVKKFMDPSRTAANFNDPSTRPVVLYRFSDAYLLAAEAYLKSGDNVNAAKYLNLVRERAAWRSTNNAGQNAAAATAMDVLPGAITLDFILDERTREFYGEGFRWFDLVRTQSLITRVKTWNPVEAGTHIQPYMALRPIPQSQIDAISTGPKFPQNMGY